MTGRDDDLAVDSWLVSAGREDAPGAPLNVPLVPASNFVLGGARSYSRDDGTPTREALEGLVGGLEGGPAVALDEHPAVERVRYPGLASHRTHTVARRQLAGFGAVFSFDVVGGAPAADRVCRTARLIRHATSLGGVETTMERRAAVPGQEHLPPGLLRLSVGIEDAEDLWRDLSQALDGLG